MFQKEYCCSFKKMNSENIKRALFFYILITKYQSTEIFELFVMTTLWQRVAIAFIFTSMWNATLDMQDKIWILLSVLGFWDENAFYISPGKIVFMRKLIALWGESENECLCLCSSEILAFKFCLVFVWF